jgi:hypothetical protein
MLGGMSTSVAISEAAPSATTTRPGYAWRHVAIVAVVAFAVEMAVSARYGYVRDELYFLAAGHHPAFGYVDQPPMTPLLAAGWSWLTGGTLAGFRVLPALFLVAMIVTTAAMARQLGAGRNGQFLAALAVATSPEYLGAMHEMTTTTPDFTFWTLTLLLVTCLLWSGDQRWWVAIGACAGVGAEDKWNIGFLVAGLVLGFGVSPEGRRLARSRYLVYGLAIFAALAAPDVAWQAAHGWPQLSVFHALQGQAGHNRLVYLPAQVVYVGVVLTPMWIAGFRWSLRSIAGQRFRPAAVACVFTIGAQFVLGGKPYYAGAAYTFAFAAGAVVLEARLARPVRPVRPVRLGRLGRFTGFAVLGAAIAAPITLPVLPAHLLHNVPLQKINYDLAETIGWPREVALVGHLYHALPVSERGRTTILTSNYGEAGAFARYGTGLPVAYSGHNNFWLWGPPPSGDTDALAVGVDAGLLRRSFASVRQVATFTNGMGVADDEQGTPIYWCTGLRTSWPGAWPAFKAYG